MKNTVIVADDAELIVNIMKKALEDEYNVISAKDGREAIDALSMSNNIVCMLLDLNMPVYNGFMVLDYFKDNDLFNKVPIFIISGDDSKDTIEKAFTYNIVDMLNKPFSVVNVKDAVNRAINFRNNNN